MALSCPVDPSVLPSVPLFRERTNQWLLALRLRADQQPHELVDLAFQRWIPLVGPVSRPNVVDELEGPTDIDDAIAVAPDELPTPSPVRWVLVQFVPLRDGPNAARWPTLTHSRRARLDPLCPVAPLAAFPVAILPDAGDPAFDTTQPIFELPGFDPRGDVGPSPNLPPPSEFLPELGGKLLTLGVIAGAAWVLWKWGGTSK